MEPGRLLAVEEAASRKPLERTGFQAAKQDKAE
jgi:hypothetical protein